MSFERWPWLPLLLAFPLLALACGSEGAPEGAQRLTIYNNFREPVAVGLAGPTSVFVELDACEGCPKRPEKCPEKGAPKKRVTLVHGTYKATAFGGRGASPLGWSEALELSEEGVVKTVEQNGEPWPTVEGRSYRVTDEGVLTRLEDLLLVVEALCVVP